MENISNEIETELWGLKKRESDSQLKLADAQGEIQSLQSEMTEMKKQFALFSSVSQHPWRKLGSNQQQEIQTSQLPSNHARKMFHLPKDIFSVIATYDWQSLPFWVSNFIIFGIQIVLVVLLLLDQLCPDDCENVLGMPANVAVNVRITQGLALLIALVSQVDLLLGIEGLFDGIPKFYNGDVCLSTMTQKQWRAAYFLRFLQGSLGFFASFVLLVQSESVFDVLLNFLGVQFISDLDDLAFRLGERGYFGRRFQECVETISSASFLYEAKARGSSSSNSSQGSFVSKLKHFSHILAVSIILLVCIVILGYLSIISDAGDFSVSHITVEFGDEVLSYLGVFNGCYKASVSHGLNRRPIYEQLGFEAEGGKFAFCDNIKIEDGDEMEGWVFFVGSTDSDHCASDNGYILRSRWSKSFDLLEVAARQEWYTKEGLPIESALLLKIQTEDITGQCGYNAYRESKNSCSEMYITGDFKNPNPIGVASQFYKKLPSDSIIEDPQALDATLSHPIYYGASSSELIIFTGRRWVLTNGELLEPEGVLINSSGWNISSLQDYFYSRRAFRTLENRKEKKWVLLISEAVEEATDPVSPLGLQWYSPRYEDDSPFAFPFADLARPSTGNIACGVCNDETNPCYFEGECLPNGQCQCLHRTSGFLCQEVPVGDGICDERFNTEEYDFDNGDCCRATCDGGFCGTVSKSNPFGLENITVNVAAGENFENFARDMGIVATSGFDTRYDCKDPMMATFTIEITNLTGPYFTFNWDERGEPIYYDENEGESFIAAACTFGALSVRCDDKQYFQTPAIYFPDDSHCSDTYVERVFVPYGAACELVVANPYDVQDLDYYSSIKLYYGEDTKSPPLMNIREWDSNTWKVPSSQCLTEVLTEHSLSIFDESSPRGEVIEKLSHDGVSDVQCKMAGGSSLVQERYFLALLNHSVALQPSSMDEIHQCKGWGLPSVTILCDEEDRITSIRRSVLGNDFVGTPGTSTLPPEIGFLSRLKSLDFSGLRGPIPNELFLLDSLEYLDLSEKGWGLYGTIPSELGNLGALTYLGLSGINLDGTIPSELFLLDSLEFLNLKWNDLSGTIPSELGNLGALTYLGLSGNNLNGTIPSELGNLGALESLDLSRNSLEGSIPSDLGGMKKLTSLRLDRNRLTGLVPSFVLTSSLTDCVLDDESWGASETNVLNSVPSKCVPSKE